MSCMIEELNGDVQQGRKSRGKTNQKILLPDPATESRDDQVSGLRTIRVKRVTHAFHVSTKMNQWISID